MKIFDFFAEFVRSFIEICKDSKQIGSILAIVVVSNAVLFYILDANSYERNFKGLEGIMTAIEASYTLTIGDFEMIYNTFDGNTDFMYMYWIIFVPVTIVSLLVILNMLIAVMSLTLERVKDQNEAVVYREKLIDIMQNIHRFPRWIKHSFFKHKYLLIIDVDPHVNYRQVNDRFDVEIKLNKTLNTIVDRLDSIQASQS